MYKLAGEIGNEEKNGEDGVLEVDYNKKLELIQSHQLVCVDVYANWCGPCRMIAPNYSLLAATYNKPGLIVLVKQNFDQMIPEEKQGINGIPFFQIYMNGRPVDSVVGGNLTEVEQKLIRYSGQINAGAMGGPTKEDRVPEGSQAQRSSIRGLRQGVQVPMEINPQPYRPEIGQYQTGYSNQPMHSMQVAQGQNQPSSTGYDFGRGQPSSAGYDLALGPNQTQRPSGMPPVRSQGSSHMQNSQMQYSQMQSSQMQSSQMQNLPPSMQRPSFSAPYSHNGPMYRNK
jgi:thiol-disulfide isomerase/thioredoxin